MFLALMKKGRGSPRPFFVALSGRGTGAILGGLKVLTCAVLLPVMTWAESRPEGLLWNRSGLPATIPLQVKTSADVDYFLLLHDTSTGDAVLAAYFRGGAFFRVLVPPGRFKLTFGSGESWRGEADAFGPETQWFVLKPALEFRSSAARREGHLIDLRNLTQIAIQGLADCQRRELDPDSLRLPELEYPKPNSGPQRFETWQAPQYSVRSRVCD